MDKSKFFELLPAFKEKMLGPSGQDFWARDYVDKGTGETNYSNKKNYNKLLKDRDLLAHFEQVPFHSRRNERIFGSYAINGVYSENGRKYIKWNCIDCDAEPEVELLYEKLLPVFDRHGIPYILEYGGDRLERRKVWHFFKKVRFDIAERFMLQLLEEAGLTAQDLGGEMFPLTRPIGIVRIPCGYYAKRKQVFPVEIDGETTTDALRFIEAVIAIRAVDEAFIEANLKEPIREKKQPRKRRERVFWQPVDLPSPQRIMPPFVRLVATQCPAVNRLLHRVMHEKLLSARTGVSHMAGLYLAGLAQFNDKLHNHDDGKDWFYELIETYRDRDADSHNWDYYWESRKSASSMVPRCKVWERDFGHCEGCPQRNRVEFTNPKQLHYNTKLEYEVVAQVKLLTPDQMRKGSIQAGFNHAFRALGLEEKALD